MGEIPYQQHTVCGEAMAVLMLMCFRLLLLMGAALSMVSSTPVAKNWVVHSAADPSLWWQETPQYNQLPWNQHGKVFDDRMSITSWNEPAEDAEYAFVAAKTKGQCRQEVRKYGYKLASDECKGKLKFEKIACQAVADSKGVVSSDLCKGMVDYKTCSKKWDCKDSAVKACCWVPGSPDPMQCVKEVPVSSMLLHSETRISRSAMLDDIRNMINSWFVPYPKTLYVVALPVGQGDCVAMYCPNGNMAMFDCGSSNKQNALTAEEVKSVILNKVKRVTIFISHGDVDHYRHLPTIFSDTGKVDQVIIGGSPDEHAESDAIRQWMRTMANQGKLHAINRFSSCIGDCNGRLQKVQYQPQSNTWVISGGPMTNVNNMNICGNSDVSFDIIAANVGNTKNQKSIVLKVIAGSRSVLLAGDMEGSAAKKVAKTTNSALNMPGRLQSSVFQISHHGAGTEANKLEWLLAIRPQQAFVSHAHIGQYNHPRCDAIERLLSVGSIGTDTILTTSTHQFYCAMSNGSFDRGKTCHDIFSTYPTPNDFCVIAFKVEKFPKTTYKCYNF